MVTVSDLASVQSLFPNARVSYISASTAGSLQYLNIRVTERLHRYRLLKRHWHDLQSNPSDAKEERKPKHMTSRTLEPLRLQIEQDILQLRRMIHTRQKRAAHVRSSRLKTCLTTGKDDRVHGQPGVAIQPLPSSHQLKSFDRMPTFSRHGRSAVFPQNALTDSGVVTFRHPANRSASTPSHPQKIKQQLHTSAFNISGYHVNPSPPYELPARSKSPSIPRPTQPLRTSIPPAPRKTRQSNPQPTASSNYSCPSFREPSVLHYSHATSTSSTVARSRKFQQDTSLLPAVFMSNSLVSTDTQESDYERSFLCEPPIVSQDNDDCHALLSQMDRLRVTMPKDSIYRSYARNS